MLKLRNRYKERIFRVRLFRTFCFFFFLSADLAYAARYVVELPKDEKTAPYTVNIYFEPEGSNINALSGEISIPSGFSPDVRAGDSIVLLWVDAPLYDASKTQFLFPAQFQTLFRTKGLVLRLCLIKLYRQKILRFRELRI